MAANAIFDMLRQRKSPAERWCERIRCIIEGVCTIGLCTSRVLIRDILFYMNLECWDRNTPSNSPKNSDKTTFFSPLEAKVIPAPKAQGGIAHSCSSGFVGES